MQNENGYALRVVHPDEVASSWEVIGSLLEKSIEFCYGEFDLDSILEMVADRRAFILALEHGEETVLAAACEVIVLPLKKVVHVFALGGRDLDVLHIQFWDKVAEIARTLGADAVRGAVRPSMQRYFMRLAPNDFTAYAILEKKV